MRTGPRSVAELLTAALPPASRARVFSLDLIRLKWAEAVGAELARRSEPASFENRLLTVRVVAAEWGRMIVSLQGQIASRLNAAIGLPLVGRIRFVKDGRPISGPALSSTSPPASEAPPEPVEPPAAIVEAAEAVREPGFRSFLIRAASRYLAARGVGRR